MATTIRDFLKNALLKIDPTIDFDVDTSWESDLIQPIERMFASDSLVDTASFVRDGLGAQGLDTSAHSAISDLVATPLARLLTPVTAQLSELRTYLGIGDRPDLVPDDVVDLLMSNFLIRPRSGGLEAIYTIRVYLPDTDAVEIGAEDQFETASGLIFYPIRDYSFTTEEVAANSEGSLYYVELSVSAAAVGTAYNIGPNDLVEAEGVAAQRIAVLSTTQSGTDPEATTEYVRDLKLLMKEQGLLTAPGIRRRLLEDLGIATGIRVIQSGDALMTRDVLTVAASMPEVYEPLASVAVASKVVTESGLLNIPFVRKLSDTEFSPYDGYDASDATSAHYSSRLKFFSEGVSRTVSLIGDPSTGRVTLTDFTIPIGNQDGGDLVSRSETVGENTVVLNHTDRYYLAMTPTASEQPVAGDFVLAGGSDSVPDTKYTVHSYPAASDQLDRAVIYPTIKVRATAAGIVDWTAVEDGGEWTVVIVVSAATFALARAGAYVSFLIASEPATLRHGTIASLASETSSITLDPISESFAGLTEALDLVIYLVGEDDPNSAFTGQSSPVVYATDAQAYNTIRLASGLTTLDLLNATGGVSGALMGLGTASTSSATVQTWDDRNPYNRDISVQALDEVKVGNAFDVVYADASRLTKSAAIAFDDGVYHGTTSDELDTIQTQFRGFEDELIARASTLSSAQTSDQVLNTSVALQVGDVAVLGTSGAVCIVTAVNSGTQYVVSVASGTWPTSGTETMTVYRTADLSLRDPKHVVYAGKYTGALGFRRIALPASITSTRTLDKATFIGSKNSFTTTAARVGATDYVDLGRSLMTTVDTAGGEDGQYVILYDEQAGTADPISDVIEVNLTTADGNIVAVPRSHPLATVVHDVLVDHASSRMTSDGASSGTTVNFKSTAALGWVRSGHYVEHITSGNVYTISTFDEAGKTLELSATPSPAFADGDALRIGEKQEVTARVYVDDDADLEFNAASTFTVEGHPFTLDTAELTEHVSGLFSRETATTVSFLNGSNFRSYSLDFVTGGNEAVVFSTAIAPPAAIEADAHTFQGLVISGTMDGTPFSKTFPGPDPYTPARVKSFLEAEIDDLNVYSVTSGTATTYYLYSEKALVLTDSSWNRAVGIYVSSDVSNTTADAGTYSVTALSTSGTIATLATPTLDEETVYYATLRTRRFKKTYGATTTEYGKTYVDLHLTSTGLHDTKLTASGSVEGNAITVGTYIGRGYELTTENSPHVGSASERPRLSVTASFKKSDGTFASCYGGTLTIKYKMSETVAQIQGILDSSDRAICMDGLAKVTLPTYVVFSANNTGLADADFLEAVNSVIGNRFEMSDVISALYRSGVNYVPMPLRVLAFGPGSDRTYAGTVDENVVTVDNLHAPEVSVP